MRAPVRLRSRNRTSMVACARPPRRPPMRTRGARRCSRNSVIVKVPLRPRPSTPLQCPRLVSWQGRRPRPLPAAPRNPGSPRRAAPTGTCRRLCLGPATGTIPLDEEGKVNASRFAVGETFGSTTQGAAGAPGPRYGTGYSACGALFTSPDGQVVGGFLSGTVAVKCEAIQTGPLCQRKSPSGWRAVAGRWTPPIHIGRQQQARRDPRGVPEGVLPSAWEGSRRPAGEGRTRRRQSGG